jgi:thioredoxin-like negative regulator of GroEL
MCEELEPEFEFAASKYGESDEILFARVNGRAEPKIAEALGVQAYPVFKFYNKGSSDPVRVLPFTERS